MPTTITTAEKHGLAVNAVCFKFHTWEVCSSFGQNNSLLAKIKSHAFWRMTFSLHFR
jgi:hypothetical protein